MTNIYPIPILSDNYVWTISHNGYTAIVDPGESTPVINHLKENNLTLVAILITHHHGDHIGGIQAIKNQYPDIPVYGPANEKIAGLTQTLGENDVVNLPELELELTVMDIPGHTLGHIAYHAQKHPLYQDILFCGDTLFACGCGRVFEGTMEQMSDSLDKLGTLPDTTKVYCTHEYTLDNIGFAEWVEPDNQDIKQLKETTYKQLDRDMPSLPSTLAQERRTNPFMRTRLPYVLEVASNKAGKSLQTPAEVFATLRNWKDSEYD